MSFKDRWGVYGPYIGWMVDNCAGGAWSWDVNEAAEYGSYEEAIIQMNVLRGNVDGEFSLVVVRIK